MKHDLSKYRSIWLARYETWFVWIQEHLAGQVWNMICLNTGASGWPAVTVACCGGWSTCPVPSLWGLTSCMLWVPGVETSLHWRSNPSTHGTSNINQTACSALFLYLLKTHFLSLFQWKWGEVYKQMPADSFPVLLWSSGFKYWWIQGRHKWIGSDR